MGSANVSFTPPLTRLTPWYPGQFGVPGSDSTKGLRSDCNGAVFYVDPNHTDANDSQDGTNPDHPLATVTEALTRVRANSGDVIAVMFNGDWTYSDTSAGRATPIQENVVISTPGIRLIGLAPSAALGVPWLSTANNTVSITVDAMDVLIEGFCFWNSVYTGTTAILAEWDSPTLYGENVTVRHCHFYAKGYGIVLDYAWNCFVHDCKFDSIVTQAIHNRSTYGDVAHLLVKDCEFQSCASAINLPDSDNCTIEGCKFMDNTLAITMADSASENIIHGNVIMGTAAGTNNFINLSGGVGTLNMVSDNWLGCTVAQYDTTCSPGGGGTDIWCRNHCRDNDTTANPT